MIVFHIYEIFTYMNRGGSKGIRIIEGLPYGAFGSSLPIESTDSMIIMVFIERIFLCMQRAFLHAIKLSDTMSLIIE